MRNCFTLANKAVVALLAPWICYVCCACGSTIPEEKELPVADIKPATGPTPVNTTTLKHTFFEYFIKSNGKIRAAKEQLVISESSARLKSSQARNGKMFVTGSIIAQLETTAIQQKLERAEQARFNGEKEYQSQLLGYENLLKGKSAEEAAAIQQKLRFTAGLTTAEQDIREAKYEMSKTVIRAPFTGIVADVKILPGQQLKTGDELFRIYDPSGLLLEVKVLEADVLLLNTGMPADVSPISHPQLVCQATVAEVNPYVDENGMVTVKLKVITPFSRTKGLTLFPGMNCVATIRVPVEKKLIAPREAVVMRNGRAVVFTLEAGHAKWNYVTTGRDNGTVIVINDGLKEGMKVITTNNLQLAHDAPVKETRHDSLPN